MALIDILLPTHQRADVLGLAVASVRAQTFTDWVLHVVLDGCTDGSLALVEKLADEEPRLVFHDWPKGPGFGIAHRNRALRQGTAPLIAYMQHDDLWTPDHLEKVALLFQTRPQAALTHTRTVWADAVGRIVPSLCNLHDARLRAEYVARRFTRIPSGCWAHRRALLDEAGWWNEEMPRQADWEFFARCVQACAPERFHAIAAETNVHFQPPWRPLDELTPLTQPEWVALHAEPGRLDAALRFPVAEDELPQVAVARQMRTRPGWVADVREGCSRALETYGVDFEFLDCAGLQRRAAAQRAEARATISQLEKQVRTLERRQPPKSTLPRATWRRRWVWHRARLMLPEQAARVLRQWRWSRPAAPDAPLVSVIIAAKNAAPLLRESLESVLTQGGPALVECVVQDGASTDDTAAVLAEFGERIASRSEQDSGVYQAMNRALARARGTWFYFLGAGDRLRPGVLAELAQTLRRPGPALVYGDVWMEDLLERYAGEFAPEELARRNLCQQAVFYHRGVMGCIGEFNELFPVLADYEFNLRCFGEPAIHREHVPMIIADYRGGGLSATHKDATFEAERPWLVHRHLGLRRLPSPPSPASLAP